jgi:hypothetical protein
MKFRQNERSGFHPGRSAFNRGALSDAISACPTCPMKSLLPLFHRGGEPKLFLTAELAEYAEGKKYNAYVLSGVLSRRKLEERRVGA